LFKSRNSLLTEQDECAAVDACGNVNQIRTGDVRMNGSRAALVDVNLAGKERLRRCRRAEGAEIYGEAAFREITSLDGENERQIERPGCRDGHFEAAFFRL